MKLEDILPEIRKNPNRKVRLNNSYYGPLSEVVVMAEHGIMGDGWELKPLPPKQVTVTRADVERAWGASCNKTCYPAFGSFCLALGLSDE